MNAGATSRDAQEDALESVRDWLRGWGAEVAAADITAARGRFDAGLSAFGTHADVVIGRDLVEVQQWLAIWPAIEDFTFLVDDAQLALSPDGLMAVLATPWTSTGIGEDGTRFPRPGRATIVLRRSGLQADWLGVHTHFSLARGVPPTTHGARQARH
jgi:ketosteroid isomerase-like protein